MPDRSRTIAAKLAQVEMMLQNVLEKRDPSEEQKLEWMRVVPKKKCRIPNKPDKLKRALCDMLRLWQVNLRRLNFIKESMLR